MDLRRVHELYFDCAHEWGNIAYVMALPFDEMLEHLRQKQRIMKQISKQ
jgi:hypothetical protein